MSKLGSQIVFKELFARHPRIEVPKIQRDYAQGRESEKDVREEFLDALLAALTLTIDDDSLPLNLDFIYGSVEGDGATRFLPLDGQQRLTTLFLLHWYLAWRDGNKEDFQQLFCSEGSSRFSYSVRPSSKEFFNELVRFEPEHLPEEVDSLSEMVADQPWYFRNWRLDPTIQSSLTMLDAIHLRFKGLTGLFARITDIEHPAITFQLLDLKDFGLSDDLYIKMNSRGKPLTPFETFKARYEQKLQEQFDGETRKLGDQEVSVSEFFSRRMDTQWADFFWPHGDPTSKVYDDAIMNLFRTVILVTRSPESNSYIDDVVLLRNKRQKNTHALFSQHGWLDRKFSEALILLLETWSSGQENPSKLLPDRQYYDEEEMFSKAIIEPTSFSFEELLQVSGYVEFLKENCDNCDPSQFQEWVRVILNLSVNTVYNRPLDLKRSLEGLIDLVPHSTRILDHLANTEKPASGFNNEQMKEERLKAQLIIAHTNWRPLVDRAEKHGYFRGQIGFLLDFSGVIAERETTDVADWDEVTHLKLQNQFEDFLQKAEAMFETRGLKDLPDAKWERALLCIGNYLLPSRRNLSFLVNQKDDHASWKRLLRDAGTEREVLGSLWKRLSNSQSLEPQLDSIIDGAVNLEPWREALVRTPVAINYCYRRMIRKENGCVYLLQTTQMNGTHSELFTYCLYREKLQAIFDSSAISTLTMRYTDSITTDLEPGISLRLHREEKIFRFEIECKNEEYILFIPNEDIENDQLIKNVLIDDLGFSIDSYKHFKTYGPNDIEMAVTALDSALATALNSGQPIN